MKKEIQKVIHKANSRGAADHGWLKARHTFSFAGYYEEDREQFGALRVLNDDIIEAGYGFGMHPHNNMEIITIPLEGALKHKDSMGHTSVIKAGDVQVMSAGKGLMHSEYNASETEALNLLQIWVFPKHRNIDPRYGEKTFEPESMKGKWLNIVSPIEDTGGALQINQDAWFSLGKFEKGSSVSYAKKRAGNGLYVFVIEGGIEVEDEALSRRDAIGIEGSDEINIEIKDHAYVLIMDVPMNA
ncbi:MAG: pirin family protein [Cytophaga sp.]|uniref:pirin family protein n=1 Tax=Cytophaga sp. TaxID=29535 RepID=UPI003F7D8912